MNKSSSAAAGNAVAKKKKMDPKRSRGYNCTGQAKKSSGEEEGSELLQIVVKRLGVGSTDIYLDIDPSSTVLDLKKLIAVELEALNGGDEESIPISRHRLIYYGRMLRDDNEVLGNPKGVNMKSDVVNYVHFTPLPKGVAASGGERQQPSSNSSVPLFAARAPAIDLEARIERARRLGTARRERRRRRRSEPYSVPPPQVTARIEVAESEPRSTDPPAQQVQQQNPLVAYAEQVLLPGLHEIAVPAAAAPPPPPQVVLQPPTLPNLQPLLFAPPPLAIAMPTLAQITQLSATISAASREAEATNSWLNDRFMDHDRQAVADILPSLTVLFDRLRQFEQGGGASTATPAPSAAATGAESYDEANLRETLQLLDHLSRETANLASTLRTSLIARSHLSAALTSSNQNSITSALEQILRDNTRLMVFGDEPPTVGPLEQILRSLLYP